MGPNQLLVHVLSLPRTLCSGQAVDWRGCYIAVHQRDWVVQPGGGQRCRCCRVCGDGLWHRPGGAGSCAHDHLWDGCGDRAVHRGGPGEWGSSDLVVPTGHATWQGRSEVARGMVASSRQELLNARPLSVPSSRLPTVQPGKDWEERVVCPSSPQASGSGCHAA